MEGDAILSAKQSELAQLRAQYDEYLTWEHLVIQNEKISKEMEAVTTKLYDEKKSLRRLRETIALSFQ